MPQDQQMALELRRRRNQLLRIQSAFERMSLGTYGIIAYESYRARLELS